MPESLTSISEIFSELDLRLDNLKNKRTYVSVYEALNDKFSIATIERNLYRFPDEAIPRINIALEEINELQEAGMAIMDKINVHDDWDFDYPSPEDAYTIDQTKDRVYHLITQELEYYKSRLTILKEKLKEIPNLQINEPRVEIIIGDDFSFPELRAHLEDVELDKYQSALFFYYLRDHNIILEHSNTGLAKLVGALTGYSEQKLRTDHGFGAIDHIKRDILKTPETSDGFYNLKTLKSALQAIIEDINTSLPLP